MSEWTDIMVDTETTGLQPDRNGIIQIGAVKFNLTDRTVCPEFFNRSLHVPTWRFWSESTRNWWKQQKAETLQQILQAAENPEVVINDFADWCYPKDTLRFWSKPSHFDWNFVSSYFEDFEVPNPFSYRDATDMNSFFRGRYFPNPVPEVHIPFEGAVHNALADSLYQLRVVFAHTEH